MTRFAHTAHLLFSGTLGFLALATGSYAQTPAWQEIAPMSVGRSEMRAVMIDEKFYVAGGFNTSGALLNTVECYDPETDTWSALASMPIGMDHHMMAAHGGKLYVLKYEDIHVYDPATDTWSSRPDSSGMTRSDGTAVSYGDHIYVIGGGPLPIQRFNPATGQWQTRASLQTSRGHVNAVLLDDKIWVLGGRSGNTAYNTVEIFDPVADSVYPGPAMDSVRSGHAAEAVNGKIVVIGGEVPNPARLARTAEVYDPTTGNWSFLPEPTLGVHGVASGSWNGRIYLFGGATVAYSATNTPRSFYLDSSELTSLRPPLPGHRRTDTWKARGMRYGEIVAFPWENRLVRPDGKAILRLAPNTTGD